MEEVIRLATIDDIDNGLLEVFIEGYRYHQNGRPDIFADITNEELRIDLVNNFERLKYLLIEVDNKVVGYVAYDIKEKHTKKMHVDQLIISQDYRKNGYGKMLMNKVKEIAIENNCDRIELDCWLFNENAINMYEHIGFKRQRIMYEMHL